MGYRIRRAVEMLLDRACPRGGWNAGNGVVYSVAMEPHLDATATALLALRSEAQNKMIKRRLGWMQRQASLCVSPWSLAWSILALDAYELPVEPLQQRLISLARPDEIPDTATLAAIALALACTASGNPFEVVV